MRDSNKQQKKLSVKKNSSKEMKIRNDFTFLGALNASSNVNFSTRKQWAALPCGRIRTGNYVFKTRQNCEKSL